MSTYYDKASLVMIPSGVKEDKLYSIKPTDGSGDFTFSRGADIEATRVNSSGLIEKAKVNLLKHSNTFDTTWSLDAGMTLTSGQSGYDGSSDAWSLSKPAANFREMVQIVSNAGGVTTYSVYAHSGSLTAMTLRFVDAVSNHYARFNLATGAPISSTGGVIEMKMTDVGGGWYRCQATANVNTIQVYIYPDLEYNTTAGNIYIQDAQLNHGLIAQDYVETTTTAVVEGLTADLPRLDYSGGASCPSLLLEPSRTNLVTQSEYFGAWNANGTASVTSNQAVSPEGVLNASLLDFGATSGGSNRIDLSISISTATDYALTIFAKNEDADKFSLRSIASGANDAFFTIDLVNGEITGATGSVTDSSISDFGNGWYKIVLQFNSLTDTSTSIRISPDLSGGSNGEQIYIYGAQCEAGSYPTSYIPTYGTAANRGADDCTNDSLSSVLNDSEGTLFLEMKGISDGGDSRRLSLTSGNSNNRVSLEYDETAGTIKGFMSSGGTLTGTLEVTGVTQSDTNKIALTYNASAFKIFVNGVLEDTDSSISAAPIGLDTLQFKSASNTLPMEGLVKQTLYFPTALTDAECIALTTI